MAGIAFSAQNVPNAFRERTRIRQWLSRVAKEHGHAIGELNFVLMDDEALLVFNRRYLGHDEYTDVITFDGDPGSSPGGTGVSGDVLISLDRVKENASAFGASMQQELRRVALHGLLHLLGHGDKSAAKKAAMRALEDKYLAWWSWTEN